MKNCVLLLVCILLIIQIKDCYEEQFYKPQGIRYLARIINLTTIDSTGQPYLQNVKWTLREMTQYLSATIINRKTYIMRRMMVQFDRCRDLEFSCEDFQSLNLTRICSYLRMKNQLWSVPSASIEPKLFLKTCPRFNQGTYVMKNATLDINTVIRYYSEAPKYYWKIHFYFYNEKNQLQHQFHVHLYFSAYTKRNNNSESTLQ